jgi:hypothetical protein
VGKGTGLGLSPLVYAIVTDFGSAIDVTSALGEAARSRSAGRSTGVKT